MTNNHKTNEMADEPSTTKYLIHATFTIDGLVEKPDVVGALFGQTEGLLTDDLDLRELQKGGRVGRIQVHLSFRGGKTRGTIEIPSSLDKVETSILAAAIETVDRIGPCNAKIKIKNIEDIRREKMKKIRERASELLQKWTSESTQESSELADEVLRAARTSSQISNYGQLPVGPEFRESEIIIIVEGRADIAACMRAGVRNTIAVKGAKVPKSIVDLTKKKTSIAFLDGDRGGDLILKELLMYSTIDYVARAPKGKEVEDLKPDEIIDCLSKKVPVEKVSFITDIHAKEIIENAIKRRKAKLDTKEKTVVRQQPAERVKSRPSPVSREREKRPYPRTSDRGTSRSSRSQNHGRSSDRRRQSYRSDRRRAPAYQKPRIPENLMPFVKELEEKEQQEGILLDDNLKQLKRVAVEKLYDELKKAKKVTKVVFDGIITQRLLDLCEEKEINTIVGAKISEIEKQPKKTKFYTFA
ncbi:MAG: DNA primase [Candidatus Gerdarchaeota archaeon]|nr:MAG: DNA primase [Candidatus Gerdarchaeota archaeon]